MMNDLRLNIFNIIIVSGVIQGFIFSFIVFYQKKYRTKNTIYLALLVLFLSLSNLQYFLLETHHINNLVIFEYIYVPYELLVPIMFYLYVKMYIHEKIKLITKIYLYFPFTIIFIALIYQAIYKLFINNNYVIPSHFEISIFTYLDSLAALFNIVLILMTLRTVNKYERKKIYNIKWVYPETRWIRKVIIIVLLLCFSWMSAIGIIAFFNFNRAIIFYPYWIGISTFVYWVGYTGLKNSMLMEERFKLRKMRLKKASKIAPNYGKKAEFTFKKIREAIINEQLFLNPSIQLKDIAILFDLNESYISKLLNENEHVNFNDFINSLRVKEVKRLISLEEYKDYTIVAISLEAGFNSKSSFYNAFKKFTGTTPKKFQKSIQNL